MKEKIALHTVRPVFLFTAVFSVLAHGYRYLSPSFSGDSMLLSQVGEEAYQTSLGRFLQPVYWQIRGYITAPLTIGLFATVFLALSALIIVHLLRIRRPVYIALVCGVIVQVLMMIPLNLIFTVHFNGAPQSVVLAMLVPIIIPFNLIKVGINGVLTFLLYKRVGKALKLPIVKA